MREIPHGIMHWGICIGRHLQWTTYRKSLAAAAAVQDVTVTLVTLEYLHTDCRPVQFLE